MEDIGNLFHGFAVVVQPFNLVLMVVGIVLGVIVGVLPGLGGANGVAILLPLTFSMSPTSAIISYRTWGSMPSPVATTWGMSRASDKEANSTTTTPSANRGAARFATSNPRRVLPTPPGPVSVSRRAD